MISIVYAVACDLQSANQSSPASGDLTQIAIVPTPVNTPEPSSNELPEEDLAVRETTRALTAWVLPEFQTDSETPAGNIISQQLVTFDVNHPEIQLIVEHKSIVGKGGVFDYFSTASVVAPNILPDLMLVPHTALAELVATGVIYPLDDLVAAVENRDLFPVANDLVIINGQRYGYPYGLSGLTHAAYNTAIYSDTLPSQLGQLTETNLKPAFPAAGLEGGALLLQLYLDEEGRVYNEEGELAFETPPLSAALRRIQTLRESGAISDSVGGIASHDEMWLLYKSGSSSLVLTDHRRFASEYRESVDQGFAQFPGSTEGLVPMVDGWVWAISTADPARQALATELLTWMANGPNMGDWTFASQMLPARQSAIDRWPQDEYTLFLTAELDRAIATPSLLNSNVGEVLQEALQSLFAETTPSVQAVAENAVIAINSK